MNPKNLKEATLVMEQLEEAVSLYTKYSDSLVINRNNWGGQLKVNIEIASDIYGNGRNAKTSLNLSESADGKKLLAKLRDDAWSRVVTLRAKARELGLDLGESK